MGSMGLAFISLRRIIIIALQIHGVLLERTYESRAPVISLTRAYALLISRRPYHPRHCMLLPYIISGNNAVYGVCAVCVCTGCVCVCVCVCVPARWPNPARDGDFIYFLEMNSQLFIPMSIHDCKHKHALTLSK